MGKTNVLQMKTKIASPLSRKALLCGVTISVWTARKLDKKVTAEVARKHNAAEDAGRYNKQLIAAEHLKEINALVEAARSLHYELTRPWSDKGPRILPNMLYAKFSEQFREIKRKFEAAADAFARGYPDFIAERRVKLNGMFNEADYPPVSQIRSKFKLDVQIMPFPDAADFRSDLDEDTVADIRAEIADTSDRVVNDAMKVTAEQIVEVVGHMRTKLQEYNAGAKGDGPRSFFLNSLVENVRDLVALLPAFNLTDDPKLAKLIERMQKELCAEDASELRENDKAREAVQKSADEIVQAVEGLFA